MTLPLVVLAGLAVVGGALNLPVHRRPALPRGVAPAGARRERGRPRRRHRHQGRARRPRHARRRCVGIALAARVYLQKRIAPVEPEILAEAWYYDRTIAAFMGGPGRQGFEAVATFDADGHRRRRQRGRSGRARRAAGACACSRPASCAATPSAWPSASSASSSTSSPGRACSERAPPRQRGRRTPSPPRRSPPPSSLPFLGAVGRWR